MSSTCQQRRIIFNDDTHELALQEANTPEGFLEHRLKSLAGTHVSTISWSVLGGWADAPVYDSKVQPIYGDAHGGPPPYWSAVTENVKALVKSGHCPLQVVIDFAHDNRMEAWASIRMNDVHDSFIEGGITTWKRKHPHLLVDTKGVLPNLQLYVTAQDFSHQEVRQRKLEIIQEICERYDIDGFELDFIRHPVFFSPTMQGFPVGEEKVRIMTTFMREVSQLTRVATARRGRPVLVAARVPDTFKLCLNVGLDVKTWLEERLVDILIAGGGYAPFTLPTEEFTSAAHRHGVPVYPCINQGATESVSEGSFLEGVRALAANWYQEGADGIYLWNLATPFEFKKGEDLINTRQRCYACLAEVGDPEALEGKNKLFCVDDREQEIFPYYAHVSSQPPLPVTFKQGLIRTGVIQRLPLVVGDDLQEAAKKGLLSELKLILKLRGPVPEEGLVFQVNGEPLTQGEVLRFEDSQSQITYPVSSSFLIRGKNFIEVSLRGRENIPSQPVKIYRMRLEVKYR